MKPLDDITVIEVDNWMAAPSAGAIMSDFGADVIKVEPLTGDPMRGAGRPAKIDGGFTGYDFQFDVDNRGKRSIAVDLARDAGADVVRRLCERADVFLCNLLPERQARFGLDPDRLWTSNSRLVHATITGYGTTGPEASRPGYDVTAFFGRSGVYDAMREGDHALVGMARTAQGDHAAGLALLSGILAALRLAERTGDGQIVEASLFEVGVWTLASDYGTAAADGAPVRKRSRTQQIVATTNRYPCGDGAWVVFNMPEEAAWPRFCAALGIEALLDDERLQTMKGRFDNMTELVERIDAALATRGRDEWGAIFDHHQLIWGPVLAIHEVVTDPQAAAIGLFPTIEHPELGPYRSVRAPIRVRGVDSDPSVPAPTIGEHTTAVLADAGYTADEIERLRSAGAVN